MILLNFHRSVRVVAVVDTVKQCLMDWLRNDSLKYESCDNLFLPCPSMRCLIGCDGSTEVLI